MENFKDTINDDGNGVHGSGEELNFRMPSSQSLNERVFSQRGYLGESNYDEIIERKGNPLPQYEQQYKEKIYNITVNLLSSSILVERFAKIVKEKNIEVDRKFAYEVHSDWYTENDHSYVDEDEFHVWEGRNNLKDWLEYNWFLIPNEIMITRLEKKLGYAKGEIATLYNNTFEGNKKLFLYAAGYLTKTGNFAGSARGAKLIKMYNKHIVERKKQLRRETRENRKPKERKLERIQNKIQEKLQQAFLGKA